MSKIFSAKRNSIEFEYEFIDGKKASLAYLSPTANDLIAAAASENAKGADLVKSLIESFKSRINGDAKAIDRLIAEQSEQGDIFGLIGELESALTEERAKKKAS
jgi:hypothetical protein